MPHPLANAIAIAVVYIECRTGDADSDVGTLEAIAAELAEASIEDQRAVANALISMNAPELVEGMGLPSHKP